nr:MAG TPA: hypothetical protein [Caudoviricetes sp.]
MYYRLPYNKCKRFFIFFTKKIHKKAALSGFFFI